MHPQAMTPRIARFQAFCRRTVLALGLGAATVLHGADATLTLAATSGSWTNVPVTGGNDAWTAPGAATNCTWTGPVAEAGRYEVQVTIPQAAGSATTRTYPEVVYTVVAADGSRRVAVDQKAVAGTTVSLGTYDFPAGTTAQVHLAPNNYQIAESGRWGTSRMWIAAQGPRLVAKTVAAVAPPAKRILVLSANTAVKPDCFTLADGWWNDQWYETYHGKVAATALVTLNRWCRANAFALTESYDAGWCTPALLATYDAVLINQEPPVLSDAQRTALVSWVQAGGGLVGLHASVNTDAGLARLFGADFTGTHPQANAHYEDGSYKPDPLLLSVAAPGGSHPSTTGILRAAHPGNPHWGGFDEWYLWRNSDTAQGRHLLVETDGVLAGKNQGYANPHPVCWCRDATWWKTADASKSTDPGKGRVWYTGRGHSFVDCFPGTFAAGYRQDPLGKFTPAASTPGTGAFTFLEHLTGGIRYALGLALDPATVPALSTLSPASGTAAGGTKVTLKGDRLSGATAIRFDGVAATAITVVDAGTVTCLAPAHGAGPATVVIEASAGTATLPNAFSYVPGPVTYYLSATGLDTNNGTAPETPWKTFAKLATATIRPGDRILLKGGDTFPAPLTLTWSGTATAPITVDSYGTGRATILSPGGDTPGIALTNQGDLQIRNLRLVREGTTVANKGGIEAQYDGMTATRALGLANIEAAGFLHGILVNAKRGGSGTGIGPTGLTIEQCEVHDNRANGMLISGEVPGSIRNLVIRSCLAYANPGDPTWTKWNGDKEIDGSGYEIRGVTDGLIERCLARDNGAKGYAGSGIWCWKSNRVTIQHCEVYGQKAQDHSDGGGFDLDGGAQDCVVQYCYSHDNDGAGLMIYTWPTGTRDTQQNRGNIIRYNVSRNDGRRREYGGIVVSGGQTVDATTQAVTARSTVDGAEVYNNTIYTGVASTDTWATARAVILGEALVGARIRNNVLIAGPGCKLVKSYVTTAAEALFQGNLYQALPGSTFTVTWGTKAYTSLAAWRTASGQEATTGLQADPLLVGPATAGNAAATLADTLILDQRLAQVAGFAPKAGSPLINAGLDLRPGGTAMGDHDLAGNAIPQGGAFEIGAYEVPAPVLPAITSPLSAAGQVTVPFLFQVTASGSPTAFAASGLPGGLILEGPSGRISGTPSGAGTYAVLLTATNGAGTSPAVRLDLTIRPEPRVVAVEDFVGRFYRQCLGRDPDPAGQADWTSRLLAGAIPGSELARSFILSPEFVQRGVDDATFLGILYRAFFDRAPDDGGLAAWKVQLAGGVLREDVLDGFLRSAEFSRLCAGSGIAVTDAAGERRYQVRQFVRRFYQQCLGREPDAPGIAAWVQGLLLGESNGTQVAAGFILSPEFVQRRTTDARFLEILYQAFFARAPDAGGLKVWSDLLAGGRTRAQVLAGFTSSAEFQALCQAYGIIAGPSGG